MNQKNWPKMDFSQTLDFHQMIKELIKQISILLCRHLRADE